MRELLLRSGLPLRRQILIVMVVSAPLLFMRNLSDPINIPKLGVLIAGVSVVAALRIAEVLQTKDAGGLNLLSVPAVAFGAPLLVAWVFSPYKGWALWGVYPRMLGLLPYLFVILFGLLLAEAFRGNAMPVAWALVGAGGVAGAYAAIQFVGLDPFDWSVKGAEASDLVVSTLGNPNFAGAFFAISLPVAVGLLFLHPDRRIPVGIATGLTAVGWVVAGSEAAWAAGVAGLVVLVGFFLSDRWRFARVAATIAAAGIGLIVVGSVVAGIVGVADSKIPATIQRRGDWWEAASDMALASPIIGRGPNAFALEHPQYRTAEDVRQVGLDITDDPHSVFLSFLTSAGAIGAVGYLIAVGWVIKTSRETPSENLLAAAFLGALTAYFIQSLVSIDTVALRTAGWTALAGFAAARAPAVSLETKSRSKKRRAEPLRALPAVVGVALLGLAGVWAGAQLIIKDGAFRHAGNLFEDGDGQAALDAYESSISFNGNIHYRRAYGNVLGDVAVAIGEDGEPFMDKARDAFDFVHTLPQVNATLDYAHTLKDWALVVPSAVSEAADAYELTVSYDPIDTVLLAEASSALLELEADERVVEMLQPVVNRFNQAALWGNLALAQARLGEEVLAQEAVGQTLALDPSNAIALQAQEILNGDTPES